MKHAIIAAAFAIALAGCSEHDASPDPKASKELSRNVGLALCSEDKMIAASALSDIAGASEELGQDISQSVYDEATDIAQKGCPTGT